MRNRKTKGAPCRSEEHTSELQSQSNLVCRLPLEKKKKRDMLNYYYQVAPYLLPYLKDRPQSLNRFPNGIKGKSFYQKDVTGKAPDWIKMEPYTTSEGEDKNFLVPEDEASILYMANAGAIDFFFSDTATTEIYTLSLHDALPI